MIRGALILALLILTACTTRPSTAITFGGDVFLAREGEPLFTEVDPWGDAQEYLSKIEGENQDSLFLINLESPLNSIIDQSSLHADHPEYNLCANFKQAEILQDGGVDFASLNNNHQNDCGSNGINSTQSAVNSMNITASGVEGAAVFMETPSGKIGIISENDVTGSLNVSALRDHILKARPFCDLLIVSIHWGIEYQAGPTERQIYLAQVMADNGVDIVWGHHPHVLQRISWLESTQGDHQTLVMYSLGNLLSDQWFSQETQKTALVTVQFEAGEITSVQFKPLMMDRVSQRLIVPSIEIQQKIMDRLELEQITDGQ